MVSGNLGPTMAPAIGAAAPSCTIAGESEYITSKDVVMYRSASLIPEGGPWLAQLECNVIICWTIACLVLLSAWPYCGTALVLLSFFNNQALYVSVALFASLLLPVCKHNQGVVDILDSWVFEYWRRYYSYKLTYVGDWGEFTKQVIFAEFPHGAFPVGELPHVVFPSCRRDQCPAEIRNGAL